MAEFGEVFTQMKRMCKANNECCAMCDLSGKCPANEIVENYDAGEIEKIVMQWAAEHPEPKYPTWYEYLFNVTRGENKWPVDDHEFCRWLDTTHIPADIAQKLGIEPKEKNHGA